MTCGPAAARRRRTMTGRFVCTAWRLAATQAVGNVPPRAQRSTSLAPIAIVTTMCLRRAREREGGGERTGERGGQQRATQRATHRFDDSGAPVRDAPGADPAPWRTMV